MRTEVFLCAMRFARNLQVVRLRCLTYVFAGVITKYCAVVLSWRSMRCVCLHRLFLCFAIVGRVPGLFSRAIQI